MLIYDAHCHLAALMTDPREFRVAVAAIKPSDAEDLIAYRRKNSLAKIGFGLHPWFIENNDQIELDSKLTNLIDKFKPDFIGETGLDKNKANFAKQIKCLEIHIELAREFKLPIIIHCVRAYNELLQTLKKYSGISGMIHAYNGNTHTASQLAKFNMRLGIGSIILNNDSQLAKSITKIPNELILLETDAPYMPSFNKQSSTTFDCLLYAQRLSQLKNKSLGEIIAKANENWLQLFT